MTNVALWRQIRAAPHGGDAVRVADFAATLPADIRAAIEAPAIAALLAGVAAHSPFLWRLASTDATRLHRLLHGEPWPTLDAILDEAASGVGDVGSILRRARQAVALLIALADLGGVWRVEDVTEALSRAADVFVQVALRTALREARDARKLQLQDPDAPEAGCGLAVLAMGKHGARELNYSSDVDLIAFYDPSSAALAAGAAPGPIYVRIVQRLARLLGDKTAEGYALRVDLRLRPDPGSTAVAVALPAAFAYYEAFGQNWERAALIKARPVAGDIALGATMLTGLAPFIWRKYFDYAAIADIHAMKRQIHAVRGHGELRIAGHDIKLGRGGIREIEFFVQTQQLIFGGKRAHLRGPRTLDMLAALHAEGWVSAEAVDDLSAAYRFLRTIEHRLQMVADEQTHRLPRDRQALDDFARFCGFADVEAFADVLNAHQTRVVHHYALLFEDAPALDTSLGSLVFTGVEDDPETLGTLAREGFKQPAVVTETVRGWHFGRRAAVRSPRAREILTELVPRLLHAFAQSGDPDAALAAFDSALAHMPAATELFAILRANAQLLALFADVLGGAPRLAHVVTRRPHLLDAAIDPAFFEAPFDAAAFARRAERALATATTIEESLDAIRDFAHDEMFTIGLRLFSATIEPEHTGHAYSALADAIIGIMFSRVQDAFAREHGRVARGACVVVALGRLGVGEMTANSDLDLMIIYDFDATRPMSDGARPLHAVQYYTRLTQRLISALTVATRRGRLYEVDMRLRPSGGQGPLATQLRSFIGYQRDEAQTWEHMALTRLRIVTGDGALAASVVASVHDILTRPPAADLRADIAAMRRQVAAVKGDADPWDLKRAAGGMMDVDFIAQYLQLRHGAAYPDLPVGATRDVLARAARHGVLSPGDADVLIRAERLYARLLQVMRLILDPASDPMQVPSAVGRRLAAVADLPDMAHLARELALSQTAVRRMFDLYFA